MVFVNYEYIKIAEKKSDNNFFLLQRQIGFNVEEDGRSAICENTAFLCNNCNCSSSFFSYFVER